jgi:hypothetical protein
VEAASHDGGVVSLARGGRGEGCEEKEVTRAFDSDIKFSLDENSQTGNETFIVIGKIAARGF